MACAMHGENHRREHERLYTQRPYHCTISMASVHCCKVHIHIFFAHLLPIGLAACQLIGSEVSSMIGHVAAS